MLLEVFSFRPKILGVEVDVNALMKKIRGRVDKSGQLVYIFFLKERTCFWHR